VVFFFFHERSAWPRITTGTVLTTARFFGVATISEHQNIKNMPKSSSPNREEAISKALDDLSKGKYPSITAAARAYAIPLSTLAHRSHGRQNRNLGHAAYQLLSPHEEKTLEVWIRHRCRHGCPSPYDILRDMVNMLLQLRHTTRVPFVGSSWPQSFLNRHPKLKQKRLRSIALQRQLGTTRPVIEQWFVRFTEAIRSHGIQEANMWNMDEKGFAMGLSKSQKAMVATDSPAPFLAELGNRTWVSVLECINPMGVSLTPSVVFKGQHRQEDFYDDYTPEGWHFAISPQGWTDDALRLRWLMNHFEPLTRPENISEWRLLLLNGHGSHTTWQFQHYCLTKQILLHVLPPHMTRWTQPLDVGVFGPLGRHYAAEVDETCCNLHGVNISKPEFITLYQRARVLGFAADNVVNAWKGSGMHPVDSERVLSKLPPERPLTPEQSQESPFDMIPESV